MGNVIRALFWLWLVGSLAVLAYRIASRRQARREGADRSDGGAVASAATAPAAPATPAGPVAPTAPTRAPSTSPDPPAPPAGEPGATWGAPPATSAADGQRRGLFAAGGDVPRAASITEALEGITLPCGLTPVIDVANLHLADKQVVFSTTDAHAPEVGARFGDALEALGYDLSSVDDVTAVASRPDAVVALRIHPRAGASGTDGRPVFPTLPEQAVVLVCDLRAR